MELPKVVKALVAAQNDRNSAQYARCFSATASVYDEGQFYSGHDAIVSWNEKTNREYDTTLKPLHYSDTEKGGVLEASVSGTFPGSPAVMQFHFEIRDGLIESLRVTG